MLTRLLGLETEYAIRFSPDAGYAHPGNLELYEAIATAIRRRARHVSGDGEMVKHDQFFIENGGAFCYETTDGAIVGGLLEGSTAECAEPLQLLAYQRAQDLILTEAVEEAELALARRGVCGTLGLLKNCRDGEGNTYGAQENYEADIAEGAGLALLRLGTALLLPVVFVSFLLTWTVIISGILALLVGAVFLTLGRRVWGLARRAFRRIKPAPQSAQPQDDMGTHDHRAVFESEPVLGAWTRDPAEGARTPTPLPLRLLSRVMMAVWVPTLLPQCLLLRLTAFRTYRQAMLPFLISRPIVTGAGALMEDGRFVLSEKAPSITRTMRLTIRRHERTIFDPGNLLKAPQLTVFGRVRPIRALFRQRQRMQLGLSDSNLAELAEYLKIGTTALVVDMAEAGVLADAPRLSRPIRALHRIADDPSLTNDVRVRGGEPMTALALQRWYLEKAKTFIKEAPAAPLQAAEIVTLWGQTLDALETNPSALIGRLDWVTKRHLLEQLDPEDPPAVRMKLSLRYHELGDGYYAQLADAGLTTSILTTDQIARATCEPPNAGNAPARSHLIRTVAAEPLTRVALSWDRARVRRPEQRVDVIDLAQYRRDREKDQP